MRDVSEICRGVTLFDETGTSVMTVDYRRGSVDRRRSDHEKDVQRVSCMHEHQCDISWDSVGRSRGAAHSDETCSLRLAQGV